MKNPLFLLIYLIFSSAFSQKIEPKLLLANQKDVRLISLKNPNITDVVANKLGQAAACDYIFDKSLVFWIDAADYKKGKIQSTDLSKSHHPKIDVIASGMEQPDGLACDWIGEKIYWTDAETKRIEVSELDGSSRKVLIWGDLDQPRAIAVDPHQAYMYWTDWGEVPKIERAGMDGTNRQIIVTDKIYWPNGITLDYEEKKVYWIDANFHAIYRVDMNGENREEVINGEAIRQALSPSLSTQSAFTLKNSTNLSSKSTIRYRDHSEAAKPIGALQHPFAIALYNDKVYWTDWATDSIHSILKNGSGLPDLIRKDGISPMDLQIYGSDRQKTGSNPCWGNNGGCSHLCLLSPDPPHYACACPTGVKINEDNKTCANGPGEFLLLARRSDIRLISLDTTDFSDVLIPAGNVQHAVAIEFDPVDQFVYWTDDELKKIFRSHLNGSESQAVVSLDVEHSDGVAIDWVARNLYWTDTGRNYISVSRLNGEMRKVLIDSGVDEPRAIALDPAAGRMYWSDWGKEAKIEVANMDGGDRRVLVGSDIQWPNGLALDRANKILYWADARKDRIEMIRFDGTGRAIILSDDLPHVFGLSFLNGFLYWTDWQRRCIERMNINSRQSRQVIKELPDVFGVALASTQLPSDSNPCADNNGGCSHLCLYTPQGPKCHCPSGFELAPSLKDCFIPEAFLLISFAMAGGIRKIPLDTAHSNTQIPFNNQVEASFLDFSVEDDQIYWTNAKEMVIMRSFMNGSHVERFLDIGIDMLEGIAVDWIGRNVFWADSSNNRIEVIHMNRLSRKLILCKNIENPRSLALDPEKGYIYWSEWGREPRIKRADMNGDNVILINKGTIGRANSLTIDHVSQRLYYVDFDINTIVSSDMTGRNVLDVVRGGATQSISSLTLYGEYVYWSDSKRHSVIRANKITGSNEDEIQSDLNDIDDVVIYHPSRQSGVTSCAKDSGGCQHLCLSLPQGLSTCACPSHYILNSDNRTCSAPMNFLLLSQTRYLTRIIFHAPNSEVAIVPGRPRSNFRSRKNRARPGPDAVLPVTGIQDACAIDFDPINNLLFWIDCRKSLIMRSNLDGTEIRVLFRNNATTYQPHDLSIDVYSKLLYWTEVTTNTIRAMRFDGTEIGVVLKGKVKKSENKIIEIHPRKIVVDSLRGLMYFSNTCEDLTVCRVMIMESAVDGSSCLPLISHGLRNVTAMVVDSAMMKLYWADRYQIESVNLDGGDQKTIVDSGLDLVVGLAVFGPDLYWVDSETSGGVLEGASKEDGSNRRTIQSRLKNLRDLVGVVRFDDKLLDNHPCSLDNGGCTHICVKNDDHTTRCSCPDHLVLVESFKCQKPSTCESNFFTCKRTFQCIPISWVCDKNPECEDKSDEEDCPQQIPLSCEGKFSCGSEDLESLHPLLESIPQCIDFRRVCDGVKDCLNGKDEKKCSKCKAGEISCRNGLCIPASSSCSQCKNGACLPGSSSPSTGNVKEYVVPLSVVGAVIILLAILGLLKYCMSQNNSFPSGVVMFTSNEHGHFNVEFQSHNDAPASRSSVMGGSRKRPFFVSIVRPPTANSSGSQAGTSRSGWPVHKDGRLGHRPKLSGASCTSSFQRFSGAFHSPLESCPEGCCSSSGTTSFHDSCSGCKRLQRMKRYRKSTAHGAPPPTPCTTDTCEDFEKGNFHPCDPQVFPHEPPPPYYRHHTCCSCFQQHSHCHASSSIDNISSRRYSNSDPPSYERSRSNRRRHYHRRYAGMTSDSDPCPPPPTPRSQYMSECCDTTEVEDAHEMETMSTRMEEREEDEETVLLAPSRRSSPSATEMSFSSPYNPPPSPVSSR